MSEIYKHLSKLYELTRNPKYALDIADLCITSNIKENLEYANSIYKNLGDSYECDKKVIPEYFKDYMSKLLDKKTIDYFCDEKYDLTVIIPTMWKSPSDYFIHNISVLSELPVVKKIIIIDNSPKDNYLKKYNENFIEIITNETNVGVNPAWNQGLEKVDTKYYLLLNDDCLISHNVIRACVTVLESDNTVGIVNCHTKKVPLVDYVSISDYVEYTNHLGANPNGWFIMGHTKDYKPIPKELVYFYGDNFIHYNVIKQKKRVAKVISHYISHDVSTTVNILDLYKKGLLESEGVIYRQIIGV